MGRLGWADGDTEGRHRTELCGTQLPTGFLAWKACCGLGQGDATGGGWLKGAWDLPVHGVFLFFCFFAFQNLVFKNETIRKF